MKLLYKKQSINYFMSLFLFLISYGSVYALDSKTAINKGLQIATKGNDKGALACTSCHGQKG
jgi:cytochrome c553